MTREQLEFDRKNRIRIAMENYIDKYDQKEEKQELKRQSYRRKLWQKNK